MFSNVISDNLLSVWCPFMICSTYLLRQHCTMGPWWLRGGALAFSSKTWRICAWWVDHILHDYFLALGSHITLIFFGLSGLLCRIYSGIRCTNVFHVLCVVIFIFYFFLVWSDRYKKSIVFWNFPAFSHLRFFVLKLIQVPRSMASATPPCPRPRPRLNAAAVGNNAMQGTYLINLLWFDTFWYPLSDWLPLLRPPNAPMQRLRLPPLRLAWSWGLSLPPIGMWTYQNRGMPDIFSASSRSQALPRMKRLDPRPPRLSNVPGMLLPCIWFIFLPDHYTS